MPESQPRRLAAILAADVAGYSALMGADDARTVRDLKGHQAVVLPKIAEFGGRIIDTAGDGILAEFASVMNARRNARWPSRSNDGGAQRRQSGRRAACNFASASIIGDVDLRRCPHLRRRGERGGAAGERRRAWGHLHFGQRSYDHVKWSNSDLAYR